MATLLDKDLVRETTIKVDNREIQITISADQSITMKLKGMKSGSVTITIEELFNQLSASEVSDTPSKKKDDNAMMSLHDIRHRSNIKLWDYPTTVKFDSLLSELIQETKK